jgi:hypothetical protein
MNSSKIYIIVGIVVIVIIIGLLIFKYGSPGTTGVSGTTATNTSTPTSSYGGTATSPTQIVIKITAPAAGDIWKIGTKNSIAWTKAPNVTGYIYLINAETKNLVGVITPQIGPQQTSYPWDTRQLGFSRTNPAQKDVVPGTYYVSIAFDGNHLPIISSPIFTIVN